MQNFADETSGKAVITKTVNAVGHNTNMRSMETGHEKGVWI
jgi:hypothetical protein